MSATEGRQVLPTSLLPVAVVSELERRARRSGVDPADRAAFARFLGDLVAAELPGALAETAKTLLAAGEQAERQRLKIQGAANLLAEGRRVLQVEMLEAPGSEPWAQRKGPGQFSPRPSNNSPARQPATSDSPSGSRVAGERAVTASEVARAQVKL